MDLPLASGTWAIDPAHSTVEFVIRHLGLSKVRGRFNTVDAQLRVGADLDSTQVEATVDLASVDTNNADRDAHLRSTDFFNVDTQPTMHFASRRIEAVESGYRMSGPLTLNDITAEVSFDVEFNGTEVYPVTGKTHAGFSVSGELSRKEWGIDFNVPLAAGGVVLGEKVRIEMELQFEQG